MKSRLVRSQRNPGTLLSGLPLVLSVLSCLGMTLGLVSPGKALSAEQQRASSLAQLPGQSPEQNPYRLPPSNQSISNQSLPNQSTPPASQFQPNLPAPGALPQGQGEFDKWHVPLLAPDPGIPPVNLRIVNYAVEHLGQQVGNGECWTLANEAMIAAGAQPPKDYVFGRALGEKETWLPGDIIQFTNCRFIIVQPHRRTTINIGSPNHTAVIYASRNGRAVILQQNVNGDRRVQTQGLDFSNMVKGKFVVYRPVSLDGSTRSNAGQFYGGPGGGPNASEPNLAGNALPRDMSASAQGAQYAQQSMAPQQEAQAQELAQAQAQAQATMTQDGVQQAPQLQQPYLQQQVNPPGAGRKGKHVNKHREAKDPQISNAPMHKHNRNAAELGPPPEVSSGPYFDERRALLERIRALQSNGVDVYYYMQRFLEIDTRAHQSVLAVSGAKSGSKNKARKKNKMQGAVSPGGVDANAGTATDGSSEIHESIGTLEQLLNIREAALKGGASGTATPNLQQGQQYPPPGQQYPPPGQQYPPPGQQYPPPGQQ